jgi:hypothetical protein
MDYQSNSHKSKDPNASVPEKVVEKVITGEVVTKKRSLGRRAKDLFISADLKSVSNYIFADVLIPAARNMIVDSATKGVERMMYGENAATRRRSNQPGPRYTYNTPVQRGGFSPYPNPTHSRGLVQTPRQSIDDIILTSREEAETVLERLQDLINEYNVATVADFNELVGLPAQHTDNKWGWLHLRGAQVRQIREGYLLELPPSEPI